jgi:AcrR family transcriptional regulator
VNAERALGKVRTRAALMRAAGDLFENRGFEETTLEEVAARAGLHVQTLYRHFPSKNELASAVAQDVLDRFREAFEHPERREDTLAFWRGWVDRCSREATRDGGQRYRRYVRRFYATPNTSTTFLRIWYQYEDLLAAALAVDFGVDPARDSLPRLVACMLWAGNVNAVRRWALSEGGADLNQICVTVVDDVIALFGERIGGRAARPCP